MFLGRSHNVNRKLNFSSRFLKNGGAGEEKLFSKVGSADSQTSPLVISNIYVTRPISLFIGQSHYVKLKYIPHCKVFEKWGCGGRKAFFKKFSSPAKKSLNYLLNSALSFSERSSFSQGSSISSRPTCP